MAEKKYANYAKPTGTAGPVLLLQASPQIFSVCDVIQGPSDTDRIGDKILLSSLEARWHVFLYPNLLITPTQPDQAIVRIIYFQWKDDTFPTYQDIMESDPSGGVSLISQPMWLFNHDKKVKRKVLCDKTFVLTQTDYWNASLNKPFGGAGPGSSKYWQCFYDMKNMGEASRTINYQASSTVGVNKIYCLILTDVDGPLVMYQNRINYTDM